MRKKEREGVNSAVRKSLQRPSLCKVYKKGERFRQEKLLM
jgi:hypothetical protein